jgi:hypothetical protein
MTSDSGFYSLQGQEIVLFSTLSRQDVRSTQPPIHWVPGPPFPWEKRPECEAHHSPAPSAEAISLLAHTYPFKHRGKYNVFERLMWRFAYPPLHMLVTSIGTKIVGEFISRYNTEDFH